MFATAQPVAAERLQGCHRNPEARNSRRLRRRAKSPALRTLLQVRARRTANPIELHQIKQQAAQNKTLKAMSPISSSPPPIRLLGISKCAATRPSSRRHSRRAIQCREINLAKCAECRSLLPKRRNIRNASTDNGFSKQSTSSKLYSYRSVQSRRFGIQAISTF